MVGQLLHDRLSVENFGLTAFTDDVERRELVWRYEGDSADVDLSFSEGLLELAAPDQLLSSPALYGGIVVAALFFSAAVWMRRFRDES